ncbi:MAG: hypothetical protein Tp1124SUR00d2C54018391_4 [Prokaryotic dsDNA virus sp.]|nr:MAG: hypothetical protein Tp1124SUR00d2C54018391_4 [Prokaryotic dsDNA virus sp.]|tara:strand:+ start:833 stop:1612 length:780 start_codon:yes stop_codon:yes gene_type:complete
MAKRFIETDIWKKRWWRNLPPKLKLFYIYLLTQCDHAGMWDVDIELAEFQIGMPLKEKEIKEHLGKHIKVIKEDKYFIKAFPAFQYNILNPNVKAHASVIKILDKYNCLQSVTNTYASVQDKDKDKDKDKVKEKNMDVAILEVSEAIKKNIANRRIKFINEVNEFHKKYSKDMRINFCNYWTEPNKSKTKMKFELEKTWDTQRRLSRWANNDFNNKKEDVSSGDLMLKRGYEVKKQLEEAKRNAASQEEVQKILQEGIK